MFKNEDIHLTLLAGLPLKIPDVGTMRSPVLRDIARIGESTYNRYLSALLLDADNFADMSLQDIDIFHIICLYCHHDSAFMSVCTDALRFLFNEEQVGFGTDRDELCFYLGEPSERRRIDRHNFPHIRRLIRFSNSLEHSDKEFRPANSKAKELINIIMQARKTKQPLKENMNLHSIVSGIAWKSHTIDLFNAFDLTIYQLFDGFYRLNIVDTYHYTLQGIYTGSVDSKQINYNKLHWSKIIE